MKDPNYPNIIQDSVVDQLREELKLSRTCILQPTDVGSSRRSTNNSCIRQSGLLPEGPVMVEPKPHILEERVTPASQWTGSTRYEPAEGVHNILITGGAGFIASWLTRHLAINYADVYNVVCFDKLDYCASMKNIECLLPLKNFSFYYGDILNTSDVLEAMEKHQIDTVFHFAAQSHVDLSFANSLHFTKTNVEGTHILLECAVKSQIRRFIHVSTDEVMGEVSENDADLLEESVLSPTNPYAASKAAAEMYINAYAKSFKLPAIIVRSNNVYGPCQYPEKVIPKFVSLLLKERGLVLHGEGHNSRRYLYASDAADAFDTILHRGKIGEIYNVDSCDEVSNADLAVRLLDLFQVPKSSQHAWIRTTHDRPFNDRRYAVDGQKLRKLGWQQRITFEQGIRDTIAWYSVHGAEWWGDVSRALEPFPLLHDLEAVCHT